jgi:hypothetical protein
MLGCRVSDRAETSRHLAELAALVAGADAPDTAGAAQELRRRVVRWVHRRNQFAIVDALAERRIEGVCERLLSERARRRSIEEDIAALATLVAPFVARSVVCAEYDPELQLRVLGLEATALPEPVLDLGCGPEARLVRWLRERGISAAGIDRHAGCDAVIEADFLEHPLGTERWGAIVSHHGFSLHFIHHHLGSEQMAARYAARTLQILFALRPGGVFAYAPGLPFFEPVLSRAGWLVQRVELGAALADRIPPELAERAGASVAYCAQIRRSR